MMLATKLTTAGQVVEEILILLDEHDGASPDTDRALLRRGSGRSWMMDQWQVITGSRTNYAIN